MNEANQAKPLTSDDVTAAAMRLKQFATIAMRGTPSQAPAYRDAAYMEVYNGTPHNQLSDMIAVANDRIEGYPVLSEEGERLAAKYREEGRKGPDGPEGTREGLSQCGKMLNAYARDLFHANEKGQIHFARAMMESTADEIAAFLAKEKANAEQAEATTGDSPGRGAGAD